MACFVLEVCKGDYSLFRSINRVRRRVNRINRVNRRITRISRPRRINRNKGCLMGFIDLIKLFSDLRRTRKTKVNLAQVPLDNLTGHQFEIYLAKLLKSLGYEIETTSKTGDFGADLIATIDGDRRVIQAKRYSSTVGIRAIQEVLGAKKYYKANSTGVITTNYFTPAAKKLAKVNDVVLIDRDGLLELISKVN